MSDCENTLSARFQCDLQSDLFDLVVADVECPNESPRMQQLVDDGRASQIAQFVVRKVQLLDFVATFSIHASGDHFADSPTTFASFETIVA